MPAQVLPADDPSAIARAAACLRDGGLVAMPTETVYGLAADATNLDAVLGVFRAKERPAFDPLIVHVADADQAWTIAKPSDRARKLTDFLWPGPLTLVLPRHDGVLDAITSGLPTVAVRCPHHDAALALLRASGRPLVAPSANRFGQLSPTTAEAVLDQLGDRIDLVLDAGPCRIGVESTVLRPDPEPLVLRPGGLVVASLSMLLSETIRVADAPADTPDAPGRLVSHYAPRKPLRIKPAGAPWPDDPTLGALCYTGHAAPLVAAQIEILSADDDLGDAARRFFAALRALDQGPADHLLAELVPDEDLGRAINDRLRKAAAAFA